MNIYCIVTSAACSQHSCLNSYGQMIKHVSVYLCHVYLKVWIGHTFRDLFEQRLLDFLELRWLNDIQNLLDLTQKHHLIREETWSRKQHQDLIDHSDEC